MRHPFFKIPGLCFGFQRIVFVLLLLINCCVFAGDQGNTGDVFIKIPPISISVIQERQLKANYRLSVIIEVTSPPNAKRAQKYIPLLVNAMYTDLYGLFAVVWTPVKQLPLPAIKKRLKKVCEHILGKASVRDVLIQNFTRELPD